MLQRKFKETDYERTTYAVGSKGTKYEMIQEIDEFENDWIVYIDGNEYYSSQSQGECAAFCYGFEEALSM